LTGLSRSVSRPDFEVSLRFCSAGIVKFRGFAARNHHSRPGLFLQAMRDAAVAAIARATANRGRVMLSWVVTFLVVALIAGILGFGGIAGASVEIAKAIFFIAVILFLISAVVGLVRGRSNV
jgi:uncharacterized membrane protein YtjA (UPF0391 family)